MAGHVRIRTTRLELEYFGSTGTGPPLVLLHGNFATWRWWRPVLDRLKGRRVLAPTMRGCRGSPGGAGGYSIEELSKDVESFAEATGLERFHLVGHSLGAAVALEYALSYPHRLLGLDLVAPAPDDRLESLLSNGTHTARMLRAMDIERPMNRLLLLGMLRMGRDLGTNRRYLRQVLTALTPGFDHHGPQFEELVHDAAAMEPQAVLGLYQGLKRWVPGERLARMTTPTRLLAGGSDELVPLAAVKDLAARIPGAELTILPERGHSPMLERPDEFVGWLSAGLKTSPEAALVAIGSEAEVALRPRWGWVARFAGWLKAFIRRLWGRAQPAELGEGDGR